MSWLLALLAWVGLGASPQSQCYVEPDGTTVCPPPIEQPPQCQRAGKHCLPIPE